MKITEKSKLFNKLVKKATITQSIGLSEPFVELQNAYQAYFTAFNYYTTDYYEKRLNENKENDLKDINLCLIKIINTIALLAESIDSGQHIIIEKANSNLMDIADIGFNIIKRYNLLRNYTLMYTLWLI